MKRFSILIFALLLIAVCFSASACSGTEVPPEDENTLPETFDSSLYIKNKELWNGKRLTDDGLFNFVLEYHSDKIEEGGFGVSYDKFGGDFLHDTKSSPGEWTLDMIGELKWIGDYEYFADGGPKTREEALQRVMDYLELWKKEENQFPFYSEMAIMWEWHHYAAMAGFDNLGTELGNTSMDYQYSLAMLRGAARQYGATWFIDFSPWGDYSMTDYTREYEMDGVKYSPDGGHSVTLTERTLLTSFMMGADATIVEAGQNRIYYGETEEVTPLGEMCRKLNAFTTEYNDIGTAYAPFALMMDVYNGCSISLEKGFGHGSHSYGPFGGAFKLENYDKFTNNLIQDMLWRDYVGDMRYNFGIEGNRLVNNEFGDSFDFLLYGASEELINTYKALIFTGNLNLSDEELAMYQRYVENGGVIVLNTAYVPAFASVTELPSKLDGGYFKEIPYGKGSFVVFGNGGGQPYQIQNYEDEYDVECGDYLVGGFDYAMRELCKRFIPFEFSDEIQYIISVDDDCMYLYLCNNSGIDKASVGKVKIDESKTVNLTGKFTAGYGIDKIEDIYNGNEITLDGTSFSLTLSPGEIAILKIDVGGRL